MIVNTGRIVHRLIELGRIGAGENGINCLALSTEEMKALELTKQYMLEAGLSVSTDAAGNLIGRKEGTDPTLPIVMTGSHIDTVYDGGIYDGRLGVIGGIEVLQVMNENGIKTANPIEVCAYRDEEGTRFVGSYSGARILTGNLGRNMLDEKDKDGITAREALVQCGIDPEKIHDARLPNGYAKVHVELHIEQGVVLESKNYPVGIVTGICCQLRGEFKVSGMAAHAGTTPMELRQDSLCAASEIILAIEEIAAASEGSVATVGRITSKPGGVNVVPGTTTFSLDMRNQNPAKLNQLMDEINKKADTISQKRNVTYIFEMKAKESASKLCDDYIQQMIADACIKNDLEPFKLQSGAGHDSNAFVGYCPMGMIFVRSKNGISHNGSEYSSPEDCAAGVQVLYDTLLNCAN